MLANQLAWLFISLTIAGLVFRYVYNKHVGLSTATPDLELAKLQQNIAKVTTQEVPRISVVGVPDVIL